MARFFTTAGVDVSGLVPIPKTSWPDYLRDPHRKVDISLTNNEKYMRNVHGDYNGEREAYPGFDRDVAIKVWTVDADRSNGTAYGGFNFYVKRDELNMLAKDFDAAFFREKFKDETAETLELFWELVTQFNIIVFRHARA